VERAWTFPTVAVTVAEIDFLDPGLPAGEPGARERGVRVEVRPVGWAPGGSVYASPTATLHPAVCRVDLLESAPGAADRMHWHSAMVAGEPGDRVFDAAIPADPLGWLTARLTSLDELLAGSALRPAAADLDAVARCAEQVAAVVADGLAWARTPWPDTTHDERGMAVS
jgi:hypothetical protein